MELYWILLFFVLLLWILLFIKLWKWHCQYKPPNLQTPLYSESIRYRVDAAKIIAMEGFIVCSECAFENFKHAIFCVMCGETITTIQFPFKEETNRIETETLSTVNRRRQRRALKRREWTRDRSTEQNKWVWKRDSHQEKPLVSVCCFFREKHVEIAIEEPEPAPTLNEEIPIRTTIKSQVQALQQEAERMEIEFIEAEQADASQFPLLVINQHDLTMFHHYFVLDFPTKLATFIQAASSLFVSKHHRIKFQLDRTSVVKDSLQLMGLMQSQDLCASFHIDFIGEAGIDAGGVYREWFVLLSRGIVGKEQGIFKCIDPVEQTYYLNSYSHQEIGEDHLLYFYATGRFLGRALLEGNTTGFHLAYPLLKMIVGQPLSLHDLDYFDVTTYKSLLWLMENSNVDQLCLDFSVCEDMINGERNIIDLIPNGRNILVNDDNKYQYIDCRFRYVLVQSIQSQLYVFLKGLYEVIPSHIFFMLDAEELDYIFCGTDEIDVDDWERNTKFTKDLQHQPVLKWFWECVREMPNEYRCRLLQFSTGSCRVPVAGFHALTSYDGRICPFTLKGIALVNEGYLHSHACFNRLDLPHHTDRQQFKRVLYAMLNTEVYGFTTS